MEFIWQDKDYRNAFIGLVEYYTQDFNEFCNMLINDMNTMLFDGLLALEVIKNFEDLKEEEGVYDQLPQDERD